MNGIELWHRYKRHLCRAENIGLRLDISRMKFDDAFLTDQAGAIAQALDAMAALERGCIANMDEGRMVGHYWLRAPHLAPEPGIGHEIRAAIAAIDDFVRKVHAAEIVPERGDAFYVLLVIGIGGSVLGPQFAADALGTADDPMIVRFIDNTDPDGFQRVLAEIEDALPQTLTVVISKSGGTAETRNAMLEVASAYGKAGLAFAKHAVAVTVEGSALHQTAKEQGWLGVFPMWDWVGGRTSELSPAGLFPAALQGIDIHAMIDGARECDEVTRNQDVSSNPAALLAMMWLYGVKVRGRRQMVVLPYRDRLGLLGRYLQQLVMESLGKQCNRDGHVVHEGLTVFGNKGSTDQHAYVQQLRDGADDFFVTFVEVLRDDAVDQVGVDEDATSGDYLSSFMLGMRTALYENGRESVTVSLANLSARSLGALLALFERTVGLYAELINVNAYDQPGVEAGKKAAGEALALQRHILDLLRSTRGTGFTAEKVAEAIGDPESVETVFHILERSAANARHGVIRAPRDDVFSARYSVR